jgi:hypothetical protein
MNIYGYFDDALQEKPAYDPGLEVSCPFCNEKINNGIGHTKIITVSVMRPGDVRSYFYRAHKECYMAAPAEKIMELDSVVLQH